MDSCDLALNADIIRQYLHALAYDFAELHVLSSIDSTNQYLKQMPITTHPVICCAEEQTAGRGRVNNQWYSPFGENIYLSVRYALIKLDPCLSLVIAIAIIQALQQLGINNDLQIKWPNDILWQQRKLAGILLENCHNYLIIGIGLNVNVKELEPNWCSLYNITQIKHDRNLLIAHLLHAVEYTLKKFQQYGLKYFMPIWQSLDALYGQRITLIQHTQHVLTGVAMGISSIGQLLLLDDHGTMHKLFSGETIRIRKI